MAVSPTCSLPVHTNLLHPGTRTVLAGKKVYETRCRRQWHSLLIEINGLHYTNRHRIGGRLKKKKAGKVGPFILCRTKQDAESKFQNSLLEDHLAASDGCVSDKTGKQLKALDSYFNKLSGDVNDKKTWSTSKIVSQTSSAEVHEQSTPKEVKKNEMDKDGKSGLSSLDSYFDKLIPGAEKQTNDSRNYDEELPKTAEPGYSTFNSLESCDNGQSIEEKLEKIKTSKDTDDVVVQSALLVDKKSYDQSVDEGSEFVLINLLISLNVAVFLFEIASPVGNTNLQQLSLPLIYGAKINKLILDGEWWRLVTPMFLHSGLLPVAFSSWTLLTFGPQVRRGYGSFTFFLIYVLGGICASVTSFLHTPDLTVSGTGAVFGLIGAWLIYQFQNKDMIPDGVSEDMYRKAIIATALSFLLSDGQTDEWMHLGAALSGVLFGYFTCPAATSQLDNISMEDGGGKDSNNVALVGQQEADPFKSLFTFIIFMIVLLPTVYLFEPNLDLSDLGSLVLNL